MQHFSALFKLCCYPLKTEEAGTAMTRNATLHLFPFSHINHLLTHTNTCCERANTRCPPGTTQCNAAPSSASWHEMPCAGPSIGPSPAVWPDCNTQNLFISQSNPETLKISERFFLNTFQKTVKAQRKKSQRGLQLLSRLHLKASEFCSPTRYSCDQFSIQQQQSPTTKGTQTHMKAAQEILIRSVPHPRLSEAVWFRLSPTPAP